MFEYLALSACLRGDPNAEIGGTIMPQHQAVKFGSKKDFYITDVSSSQEYTIKLPPTRGTLHTLVLSS